MNLITYTSRAAAAIVAAVAGFSSYEHIRSVAAAAGERQAVAVVLPLAIDGLIVVGTMAMLEDKRAGRRPRLSARFALGFGIVATIAANIASAQPTVTARLVAAVPAISFLIAVEVLARTGRRVDQAAEVAPLLEETPPVELPAPAEVAPASPARRTGGRPSAAERVAKAVRRTPNASDAAIAGRLGVSEVTVKRHRATLAVDKTPPAEAAPEQVDDREPELTTVGVS